MNVYELLDYDAWATARLLKAVESLSREQFVQEFAGPLSSVRQQFAHFLLAADRLRARMAQEAVPDVSPESFATPQDLVPYEAEVRRRLNDFVHGLAEEDLGRIQEHAIRQYVFRTSVEQMLQHIFNHATYHRGQIAFLLKLHGVDFPETDFIFWLNQKPA